MANPIDHPKALNLREDVVVPKLDTWLLRIFGSDNIDAARQAMAAAQDPDSGVPRGPGARSATATAG